MPINKDARPQWDWKGNILPIYTISKIIISTIERERERGGCCVASLKKTLPCTFFDMWLTNNKIDVSHLDYAHLGD